MAESKIGWMIASFFGWTSVILTIFGEFTEPYKSIVSILAILFMVLTIMRSYEKYRELKISNDERKYNIKKKHLHEKNP